MGAAPPGPVQRDLPIVPAREPKQVKLAGKDLLTLGTCFSIIFSIVVSRKLSSMSSARPHALFNTREMVFLTADDQQREKPASSF